MKKFKLISPLLNLFDRFNNFMFMPELRNSVLKRLIFIVFIIPYSLFICIIFSVYLIFVCIIYAPIYYIITGKSITIRF